MMKRKSVIVSFLIIVLLLPLASFSCDTSGDVKASLGQQFTLPLGKKASIDSENMVIRFEGVISDSRCPSGVQCVWAGEAQCRLIFTLAGSPAEMVIVQPGGSSVPATDYFIQYKIEFSLEPYPEEGVQIADSDYQLVMTITK